MQAINIEYFILMNYINLKFHILKTILIPVFDNSV